MSDEDTSDYTQDDALRAAIMQAILSPCSKSKRGVVIFNREFGPLGGGHNHPPRGFRCDGSEACRHACNKLCVHAEVAAMRHSTRTSGMLLFKDNELLHVKVGADGFAAPSGEPSCWQCSREILDHGIKTVWLLHATESGDTYLRSYSAEEFHELTLKYCELPVIRSTESKR